MNVVVAYLVMFNQNIKMQKDYFIYISPSPLFFKIWPVIYCLLFLAMAHNLWKDVWGQKSSLIFVLSNFLMTLQSGIWSIRSVASIIIAGCILAFVDNVTIWFWRVLMDEHNEAK